MKYSTGPGLFEHPVYIYIYIYIYTYMYIFLKLFNKVVNVTFINNINTFKL